MASLLQLWKKNHMDKITKVWRLNSQPFLYIRSGVNIWIFSYYFVITWRSSYMEFVNNFSQILHYYCGWSFSALGKVHSSILPYVVSICSEFWKNSAELCVWNIKSIWMSAKRKGQSGLINKNECKILHFDKCFIFFGSTIFTYDDLCNSATDNVLSVHSSAFKYKTFHLNASLKGIWCWFFFSVAHIQFEVELRI